MRPDLVGTTQPRPAGGRLPAGRGWVAVLVVGYLAQVGWRVFLSWPIVGPIAHVDEDGYLLGARVLAGGPHVTLPAWSIMRPIGYPLVLTPAYLLAQQPAHVYQIVHVINALLMATVFPLGYVLARKLFHLGRGWAAGVAFVAAALPSMVFFSQFALTEALLPELMLALLLLVYGVFASRQPVLCAVAAGALAGYAANTHVRGLVMLVVVTAVVGLGGWQRWLHRRVVLGYAASVAAVFGAGFLANHWLEGQLFPTGAYSANGRVFDRLTTIKGLGRVACDGAGQIWHLCTSTYGLAALGLAAAVAALIRREYTRPTRIVLGAALAMTVGVALATAAGTPNEGRVNNHVYGRYVAIFAGFWAIVGIAALLRSGWRRASWLVAGGIAITGLSLAAVLVYAGRRMAGETYVDFDAPELSFLSGDYDSLHIYRMTWFAIGFMVLFGVTLTGGRRRAIYALAATLALNLAAMVVITERISRAWVDNQYNSAIPQLVRNAGVRPGDSVSESSTVGWWVNVRHQHEVYWAAVPRFDSQGPPAGAPDFVVSGIGKPTDWDGTRYGYRLVLTYNEGANGIWAVWRRAS